MRHKCAHVPGRRPTASLRVGRLQAIVAGNLPQRTLDPDALLRRSWQSRGTYRKLTSRDFLEAVRRLKGAGGLDSIRIS